MCPAEFSTHIIFAKVSYITDYVEQMILQKHYTNENILRARTPDDSDSYCKNNLKKQLQMLGHKNIHIYTPIC